ncbi:TetR family transcriptional regulator [Streptomyces mirabilis]|uniref:TetR family transcriptional regulator n=1 Tax=Streptomyces mirabilis TaxID=68239 RepID=UPI0036C69694
MPDSTSANRTPATGEPTAAESTRERIVTAAKTEFSQHGIAGARVDRIAKRARTSTERVYAYFRGKEALYAFIARRELAVVADATRMDPTDLPGYAGRLFDYFSDHPEHFRLISWGRLELVNSASPDPDDPSQAAITHKIEQLRRAQEAGTLTPSWDPVDVLALVNQIATTWATQTELCAMTAEQARDPAATARRAAVVDAVQRLFPASA